MKKLVLPVLSTSILLTSSLTLGSQAEAASPKKLDEKSKIALAYFTRDIGKYSFTRDQIKSDHYVSQFPGGTYIEKSKTFDVFKLTNNIKGAPKDMRFYSTKIPKSNFVTIIGVSDQTIVTSGTQSQISYKDLVRNGKKYDMKYYLKYQNTKDFKSIVNKIKFVKAPY